MIQIGVQVDKSRWDRFAEKAPKRLAFAVQEALNNTLFRMRDAVHDHVRSRVKIRGGKDRFWFGSGGPRSRGGSAGYVELASAKQGRAYGEIRMRPPSQASERSFLLPELEEGGTKKPRQGRKHVAVPLSGRPARPSFAGPVPPAFTFPGLKFKAVRVGGKVRKRRTRRGLVNETVFGEFGRVNQQQLDRRDVQWKGLERTFILGETQNEPEGAVFQRFGPDRGDIREIHSFETEPPLPDRLDWERTAADVGNAWFNEELERQLTEQILRART